MRPLTRDERLHLSWKIDFWLEHNIAPQKVHYDMGGDFRNQRRHELQRLLFIIVRLSLGNNETSK